MTTRISRYIVLAALFCIPLIPLIVAQDLAASFSEAKGLFSGIFVLLITVLKLPFVFFGGYSNLFFPFITGKNFAFRFLIDIAVVAYGLLALAEPKYRPKFSWTAVIFKALVIWMFVADCLAVNPYKAFWSNFERMDGWITLVHIFALFIIAGAVLTADGLWRKWWLAFVGVSFLISIYSVFQLIGVFAIHQGGVRVDATIGNAAYLASYLLFALAAAMWLANESKGWLKWSLYVVAALNAFIVFRTETRGAVIGLIVAAVVAAGMWLFESGARGKKISAGILVALVVVVGGVYMARDSSFVRNNSTLARVTSIGSGDLTSRFAIWGMALHGFAERPITGWGQEGFNYVFNKYYNPSMYAQEAWFDRAHNTFLDWLIAGGLPAFLLFVSLLGSAVVALYRRKTSRAERVFLIAALVAYAVQALVVFDNLLTYIPLVMILAMAHSASSRPWKKLDSIPALPREQVSTVAAPIAIVVAVVLVWFVNVPNISAAGDVITALSNSATSVDGVIASLQKAVDDGSFGTQEVREQIVQVAQSLTTNSNVNDADKAKIATYAVTEMGKQVDLEPLDARLRLELATAYRIAGDLPGSLAQLTKASQLSPKKQGILIEEGTTEAAAGDFKSAQTYFEKAYELDKSFDEPAAYAAGGDLLAGDITVGNALLIQHFGTTTVDNNIVVYAYYQTKQYAALLGVLQSRLAQSDTVQNRFTLASAELSAGHYADARALMQQTIAAHPEIATQGQAFLAQIPKGQ
jgi:O-antigen ligase